MRRVGRFETGPVFAVTVASVDDHERRLKVAELGGDEVAGGVVFGDVDDSVLETALVEPSFRCIALVAVRFCVHGDRHGYLLIGFVLLASILRHN